MNFLVVCAVITIAVLAIYLRSYFTYPKNTSILQTSMKDFRFDQVLQKQLLVIEDTKCTKDVDIICEAWFRFNAITRFDLMGSDVWHTNRYKYVILQAHDSGEVFFFPASNRNIDEKGVPLEGENVLAIQMSAGQSVIVPLRWRYMIPIEYSHTIKCVGIHDIISYFL